MMEWLPKSVAKLLGCDPESKESIVICGPIGAGKRSILQLIAADAKLIPDSSIYNKKTYVSQIYPSITFRIWDHSCAVGMRFQPEWPEFFPHSPLGLILVLDVTSIPLFRTVRSELHKLLASDHLQSCPVLILLNKTDIETAPNEFLTVERIQKDLQLHELFAKGLKSAVYRMNIHRPDNLNIGLKC